MTWILEQAADPVDFVTTTVIVGGGSNFKMYVACHMMYNTKLI